MTRRPLRPFVFEPPPVSNEPDELYEVDEVPESETSPWFIVILPFAQLAMYAAYFAAVPVMWAWVAGCHLFGYGRDS